MTHQTKVRLGSQDCQFLEIKQGRQTATPWLPRSSPAEVDPCLREGRCVPAQTIWLADSMKARNSISQSQRDKKDQQ